MINYALIVGNIKFYLEQDPSFADVKFVTEFPPEIKAQPLNRPNISIGIESIDDSFVTSPENDSPERISHVLLRFIIHVPRSSGALECYRLVTRLGAALLEQTFSYDFDRLTAKAVTYNRDIDGFIQTVNIRITATE